MYRVMYRTTVLAILLLYTGAADAYGSLRCKGRLIDVGANVAEVMALCGEPAKRFVTQVPVRAGVLSGFTRFAGASPCKSMRLPMKVNRLRRSRATRQCSLF